MLVDFRLSAFSNLPLMASGVWLLFSSIVFLETLSNNGFRGIQSLYPVAPESVISPTLYICSFLLFFSTSLAMQLPFCALSMEGEVAGTRKVELQLME